MYSYKNNINTVKYIIGPYTISVFPYRSISSQSVHIVLELLIWFIPSVNSGL